MSLSKLELRYIGPKLNFGLDISFGEDKVIRHNFPSFGSKLDITELCSLGELQTNRSLMRLIEREQFEIVYTKGSFDVYGLADIGTGGGGGGDVPDTRTITAGSGLTGGGDFSADRTINVGAGTGVQVNPNSVEVLYGGTSGTAVEGDDVRIPTTDENDALAGTNGTPSAANPYVTDSDSRNTNARAPTAHASSHVTGGSDKIRDASGSQDGLMTTAYATKLNGIETAADVTDEANVRAALAAASDDIDLNGQDIVDVGLVDGRDVSADGSTLDTISSAYVASSRQIISGGGLTGGGDLSSNRTLAVGAGTGITVNADDVTVNYGTSSTTACVGNDTRLPTQGENDALVGTDGTPSSSNTFVTNSDARNTNARTPSVHATSHVTGGLDKIRDASSSQDGLMTTAYASKIDGLPSSAPATTLTLTAGAGLTGGGDLSANRSFAVGAGTGITVNADDVAVNYGSSSTTACVGNDSRLPTQGENDALVGSSGTPSSSNVFVTDADSRNTNSRTPTSHASSHVTGGSDKVRDASSSQDGLMTTAYASKLDGLPTSAPATSLTLTAGAGLTGGGDLSANRSFAVGAGTGVIVNADDVEVAYGSSSTTACVGNDSRLSNARTPTAHASTHAAGQSDALSGNLDATARVGVRRNSTGSTYERRRINLIEGTNVTISIADDSGSEEVDVTLNAASASGYATVQEEGSSLTQQTTINFIGAALTAVNNGGSSRTDVTLSQSPSSASVVGTGRTITATAPITIDGSTSADLSADRTIAIIAATGSVPGSMSAADKTKMDLVYPAMIRRATFGAGEFGSASVTGASVYDMATYDDLTLSGTLTQRASQVGLILKVRGTLAMGANNITVEGCFSGSAGGTAPGANTVGNAGTAASGSSIFGTGVLASGAAAGTAGAIAGAGGNGSTGTTNGGTDFCYCGSGGGGGGGGGASVTNVGLAGGVGGSSNGASPSATNRARAYFDPFVFTALSSGQVGNVAQGGAGGGSGGGGGSATGGNAGTGGAGGAAAGLLWIAARFLTGTGTLRANGTNGVNGAAGSNGTVGGGGGGAGAGGGGGGAGAIIVTYESIAGTITLTANGGNGGTGSSSPGTGNGGGGSGGNGGNGGAGQAGHIVQRLLTGN